MLCGGLPVFKHGGFEEKKNEKVQFGREVSKEKVEKCIFYSQHFEENVHDKATLLNCIRCFFFKTAVVQKAKKTRF